jgi:hypothetical protein
LADAPPVARSINKGRACRIEARRRGVRGPDASGYAAICFAEARLACTKQAAERQLQRRALNAFVRECLGFPARNRQP